MKRIRLVAAVAVFAIHLAANPHYGFFRDELYFIICGRHPQFGYVDQPPLVPLLSALTQAFGHSLFLLRAVPALFAGAGVYVTCLLALEFGGGAFAQGFAALAYFFTPVLLAFGMKVGTDEPGLLLWPLLALLIVRITRGASPRLWLWAGLVAGVAFESKYSIVFYLAALILGLLATPQRRVLWQPWAAGGAGVALLIALPNVLWQAHYGLPMLELLHNGQNGKNEIPSVPLYLLQEIVITNPFLAPLWIAGAVALFRTPALRFLGYAYVALIGEMLLFHGKHYYPANVYPIAIAAGAVALEGWTARLGAARVIAIAYASVAGLTAVPDVLPVLSEPAYVAYAAKRDALLHLSRQTTQTERGRDAGLLPGDWADMHGWPEMAAKVEAAYEALPPKQRREAVVFAGNYGEAAAIQFFAPEVPVISEHNQYWLWGPRGYSGATTIQVNGTCFHDDHLFASRTLLGRLDDPYAIDDEHRAPIWLCRDPKRTFAQIWPEIKDYE